MKIVIVITGLSVGGAETMLLKLIETIDRRFSMHVISLTTIGEIGKKIEKHGISVEALNMRPGIPNPLALIRLTKRLSALRPDVVHTWMYHADLLGGIAARLAGVPALAWCIRNSNLDKGKTKGMTRLVARACGLLSKAVPDLILSCSDVAVDSHVAIGYDRNKMRVIPNGFELQRFKPDPAARDGIRTELGLSPDVPLVGLIGRYDPQKNHEGFFKAATQIHDLVPNAHFVLAGKDVTESNPALAAAIDRAGVRAVTHMLGPRTDVPRLMASFDVLALSSHGEAFPNVLGEAMASGVPCVVTDVGDSAQIVGDTGMVVRQGDMNGLAHAIVSLLQAPAKRQCLAERARERVIAHFDIMKIKEEYERFYEDLAAARSRSERSSNIDDSVEERA